MPSRSSRSSSSSTNSDGSGHTQDTNITTYSSSRPVSKHNNSQQHQDLQSELPRSSVATYASTVPSEDDLPETPEYDLPDTRYQRYETDAVASTPDEFAQLFPSTRRILIQHDDSTSDGNMNIRLDTEYTSTDGQQAKVTLFHMRMKNLHERQFSLRRYCRESGREVCNSRKKYVQQTSSPNSSKRLPLRRSLATILQNFGLKPRRNRSVQDVIVDSEAESDSEDEIQASTNRLCPKVMVPIDTIKVEFSNYAQVEVHRRRRGHVKSYDFEYWGMDYIWRRLLSYDGDEAVYSYELCVANSGKSIAYIMPDRLSEEQAKHERAQGGWIPPATLRLTTKSISDDVGDVIVITGLLVLVDDCIKRRWHSTHTVRVNVPSQSLDERLDPGEIVDKIFTPHHDGLHKSLAVKSATIRQLRNDSV